MKQHLYTRTQQREETSLCERLAARIVARQQHRQPVRGYRPRIGILAPCGYLRDGGWPIYGGDAPTIHAILEAGGWPCLIPTLPLIDGYEPFDLLTDDYSFALVLRVLWPVVRELDGLVFTGGSDLYAGLYGQRPHPQSETPDGWRDMWERYVALLSWLLCLPTLGICRGMHLMNVALGGTLYQDLKTQWPKDRPPLLRHQARGRLSSSNWVSHPIQLARPESRLARAVRGKGELDRPFIDQVLSMHHQAVETLAPGLEVSATSPDGVIEACEETASYRWWVATQFHPEWVTHLTWAHGLFTALIQASRLYAAMPRDDLDALPEEIQGWLRQRDSALSQRLAPATVLAAIPTSYAVSYFPTALELPRSGFTLSEQQERMNHTETP